MTKSMTLLSHDLIYISQSRNEKTRKEIQNIQKANDKSINKKQMLEAL
jgi:hypothetical protein